MCYKVASQQYEALTFSKEAFCRIQTSIEHIRQQMDETSHAIANIKNKSDTLVQTMERNQTRSEKATTYVNNIHHTLSEQLEAIKQVSSSTEDLTIAAETLNDDIGRFKTE